MKHLRVLFLLVPALWSCSEAPRNAESAPEAPSTGSSIAGADSGSVDYVGLRYGSLPSGLEELGGSLLDFVDEPEYALVLVAAGSRQMLWLNRFTHRDDEGKAHWDVRAVLQLPALQDDELLSYGGFCQLDGEHDAEVVAIVQAEDAASFTTVRRAWRANRSLERFEEMPTSGVACVNEGYDAF